jgi:hypothetical protein
MLGTMLLVGGLVVLATVEEAFQSTALLMVVAEVEVDYQLAHALRVVAQMAAAMVPIRIKRTVTLVLPTLAEAAAAHQAVQLQVATAGRAVRAGLKLPIHCHPQPSPPATYSAYYS